MNNDNNDVKHNDKEQTTEILSNELDRMNLSDDKTTLELYEHQNNINNEKEFNQQSSIEYIGYKDETQMPDIMRLIQKDLSEPYSIYTYRYFIHNWPQLCFLVNLTIE